MKYKAGKKKKKQIAKKKQSRRYAIRSKGKYNYLLTVTTFFMDEFMLEAFSEEKCEAADRFWEWFEDNDEQFKSEHRQLLTEAMQEYWYGELKKLLHAYCNNINAIIVYNDLLQKMELILTAEGDPDYFVHIDKLVDRAPRLPGWQITGFRPPADLFDFVIDEVRFDPADLFFLYTRHEGYLISVRIFIPNYDYSDEETWYRVLTDMMINMLGEECYGYVIYYVGLANLPFTKTLTGLKPFLELPAVVDELF